MKIEYNKLMILGSKMGCHQRSDRSFSIKGYQFPICARCTGVVIGYICTIPVFLFTDINYLMCMAGCAIMFVDWFLQFKNVRESTNIRRLISGILGGIGTFGIQILLLLDLLSLKEVI